MIIGLTGGIASGKSTVVNYLKTKHIPICDTDDIAREVVLPGSIGLQQLIDTFGSDIVNADGYLNRSLLADKVFGNDVSLKKLNAILHPLIFEKVEAFKTEQSNAKIAVIDMPLLFETQYNHRVDHVMLVYVDEAIQYERLMKRNGLTPQQAKQRIQSQMPLSEKIKGAHSIINNNGTIEETYVQVDECLKQLDMI
ncbi:dephospho-CoA kinase [Carnobacteriaceae bacterium zg-ZUI252]|nr:dephospho-CoA kinase [Carnobacteriaceae bacterium zg-ZUI252]MBS4770426.1 dephospho-CoA kinase [Carnobacteriaceae bacterium zg-ZUI240]